METAVLPPCNQFVLQYENQSRGQYAVKNPEPQRRDIEAAKASFNGQMFKDNMSHNQFPPVSYRILPPFNNLQFPTVNNLQFINGSTTHFPYGTTLPFALRTGHMPPLFLAFRSGLLGHVLLLHKNVKYLKTPLLLTYRNILCFPTIPLLPQVLPLLCFIHIFLVSQQAVKLCIWGEGGIACLKRVSGLIRMTL